MTTGPTQPRAGAALTSADLAALARSWITPELAEQAGLFRMDSSQVAQLIGRNGNGDCAGIAIPYVWPGETQVRGYRLRRDRPDTELGDGGLREKGEHLSPGAGIRSREETK